MRILIVEDQEKLASLLQKSFENEGFTADYVTDGETALRRIELHHNDYDAIILDLMLPKKNGDEICREIRSRNITTPVLILTAKDGTDDKVNLLNFGADDYMIKPFSFRELLARLRALLRRPENSLPSQLQVKDITLDPSSRKVFRNGKEIKLTLKEFGLLEYLMRNANQVVNREQILANLWDFSFDSFSNVVDVHINKLRKKIENHRGEKILETVRGIGYRIKA